ncbi:energy transducer TonB [Mucilaginibacter myungsuensis]|uniref:TonB family protein n=1 Tax=Mucilaginibacter myungsuensis TaxID=649104 RepID=A0A929L1E2_9SPHI|nr:energy transducer TonB [Mucilaginibacter myungsuensis]MBE9662325.1 TonB family protein [Mucilaginibacter myungsuensis]MDN3599238.1 TonB family protein [Mucilaginibacter myungsuensis]
MLGSKLDILKPEWLEIVFNDRNKAYGAYELRKQNPWNTVKALSITLLFFVVAVGTPTVINKIQKFIPKAKEKPKIITEVNLKPPPPLDETKKPPPPPPEPPKPKVDQVRFPPPVVKPDNEVKEKDPPTVEELKVADPGQKDQKGDPTAEVRIDEPVGNSDVKAVTEDSNEIFSAVEESAEYPGGIDKFYKYLENTMKYPSVARENNVQGKVFLTFVVEKDGALTDIKVLRGIGSGCDEEAVRVVKGSKKWKPGMQNGRAVRQQYTVPISFTLSEQ